MSENPNKATMDASNDSDPLCAVCQYSLRGLPPNGACPECGTDIQFSLVGRSLMYCDLGYLRRLQRGASTVAGSVMAIVISIVIAIGGILAVAFLGNRGGAVLGVPMVTLTLCLFLLVIPLNAIFLLVGWTGFTALEPGDVIDTRTRRRRRNARLSVLLLPMAMGVLFFGPAVFSPMLSGLALMFVTLGVFLVLPAVHIWFAMDYALILAGRIPDQKLMRHARSGRRSLVVWQTVGFVLLGLGPLMALAGYCGLFDRLSKRLKEIVRGREDGSIPSSPPVTR